jgi:hypothetical protein
MSLTRIRNSLKEADEKNSKQCRKKKKEDCFDNQNTSKKKRKKKRDIRNKYREHTQERK